MIIYDASMCNLIYSQEVFSSREVVFSCEPSRTLDVSAVLLNFRVLLKDDRIPQVLTV